MNMPLESEVRNHISEGQLHSKEVQEISLRSVVLKMINLSKFLLSKWKLILVLGVLGGILGYYYSTTKVPFFTATSTFVIEDGDSGSSMSQYAGLASMMGINVGGKGSGGGIFQGDNLLELYKSRAMLEKTLLSSYNYNGHNELLIERYIQINKLRKKWSENPELKNISFRTASFSRLQDSLITAISEDINNKYLSVGKLDKRLNIIKVDVRSSDELFSKSFNDLVVKNVNDFYVQTKTKKSLQNLQIIQHQADSIRAVLNGAISGMAISIDANPNINSSRQVLRVPSQRRQIDAEANKAMFSELIKNLEMAQISIRRETPLIQVIDVPVLPLTKRSANISLNVIAGVLLFEFLIIAWLIFNRIWKKLISEEGSNL